MIGIREISYYLPPELFPTRELIGKYDFITEDFIKQRDINNIRVSREDYLSLITKSAENLKFKLNNGNIDYLIFSNTSIPHSDNVPLIWCNISHKLEINNAPSFHLRQGCCGGSMSLKLAKDLLISNKNFQNILVITADKWTEKMPKRALGGSFVSDGSVSILVSKEDIQYEIVDEIIITDPATHDCVYINSQENYLEINKNISNPKAMIKILTSTIIPNYLMIIKKIINQNNLKILDIKKIIFYNSVKFWFLEICEKLNYPLEDTTIDYINNIGHIGGSDPYINLALLENDNKLKVNDYFLMVDGGAGFTWAVTLLKKVK